jgi:hypothetical protein
MTAEKAMTDLPGHKQLASILLKVWQPFRNSIAWRTPAFPRCLSRSVDQVGGNSSGDAPLARSV